MSEPRWVAPAAVRALHALSLARFGGPAGVRSEGLLDSALARPRNLYAYGEGDPCTLAAAYAVGIVRNHPFVDGNKRAAFIAAAVFLELCGLRLEAPEAEAALNTAALAAGATREEAYAAWLRANAASA